MSANEETPLTGGKTSSGTVRFVKEVNIEYLRFVSLMAIVFMLICGKFVTEYFNNWPYKEDHSSPWDKLFNGAPTDFEYTETFIYKAFGFNHTCSLLDFNPSKTIAAMAMMVHEVPILLFVVLHYFRLMGRSEPKYDNIKSFSKIATPIQFVTILFFYMVFVNSPDGEYGTPEGMKQFAAHFTPYFLWQTGVYLMAIQQCWFLSLSDRIPFSWVTSDMLWLYVKGMFVVYVGWNWFIWSIVYGSPLFDTSTLGGLIIAQTFQWLFTITSIVIPAIFAYAESKDTRTISRIVFEEVIAGDETVLV